MKIPPDHSERCKAAEEVCRWHLGNRSWANLIINAYYEPKTALENLSAEESYDNNLIND